jgi:hypothetical protein
MRLRANDWKRSLGWRLCGGLWELWPRCLA